jgi:thiopeptide-type bacteriocin biosynthesis protein
LLFRLQEALAAPAAERLAQPAVGEALQGVVEQFGAGALDLAALTGGSYGIAIGETHHVSEGQDDDGRSEDGNRAAPYADQAGSEAPDATAGPPAALVTLLLDRIMAATAAGAAQVDLSSDDLVAVLGDVGPTPPATAELFITPCRPTPGERAGTGWLLGLHAPAGASWGRFAHALGQPLQHALHELAVAERALAGAPEVLDVAFAPSPRLADLCTHPPVREQALALTSWPAAPLRALTPADLELCADPGAPVSLSLRARATRTGVAPSPLARVRSSTAPEGIYRLLVGWNLYRQHAPWALTLGPLAQLAHLPRIAIDGFVVAPASWRVPATLSAAGTRSAAAVLTRWRRQARLPRWVQVGQMDQLLPVDLAGPGAGADLRGADRLWEIWPPLARGLDDDGRRIEAVVALCQDSRDEPREQSDARAAAARAAHQMGDVPPPHVRTAAAGWTTFKLFGADDRQDELLDGQVYPTVRAALAAGEIDGWFFLRYLEGVGPRPHLRLRIHAPDDAPAAMAAFAHRLQGALTVPLGTGALATIETAPYYPEQARLGDEAAVGVAHRIFESDSQLVCTLLADDDVGDTTDQLVRSFDALATGGGLSLQARHALAGDRRRALSAGHATDARDAEYRSRAPHLRRALTADDSNSATSPFALHRARVAAACVPLPAAARLHLLPTLLHLAAVRLAGPHPTVEARATVFWERTLEGLLKSPPKKS